MTVEDGHEDGNAARGPGRRLGSRRNGQDCSVRGRENGLLVSRRGALGIAKERQQEDSESPEDRRQDSVPDHRGRHRENQRREDEDPALPGEGNPQLATPTRYVRAIASMRSLIKSFSFFNLFSSSSSSSDSRGLPASISSRWSWCSAWRRRYSGSISVRDSGF